MNSSGFLKALYFVSFIISTNLYNDTDVIYLIHVCVGGGPGKPHPHSGGETGQCPLLWASHLWQSCIASAAAVASSSRDALAMSKPVMSHTMVW